MVPVFTAILLFCITSISYAIENIQFKEFLLEPEIDEPWAQCHQASPPLPSYLELDISQEPVATRLHANHSESIMEQRHKLYGNVAVWRGHQWLEADRAIYDQATGTATAFGNVKLGDLNLNTLSPMATYNFNTETGQVENAEFSMRQKNGRGRADTIVLEGQNYARLFEASYTTCDKGRNDWALHSKSVRLYRDKGYGVAAPVYLTLYHVPIFFSPYLSFPLNDERKSGFLPPSFGSSSNSGNTLSLPYYINIAPNYDATITPTSMTDRGVQMKGEFRYLSERSQGVIEASFLQSDDIYGGDRAQYSILHQGMLGTNWRSTLNLGYVSDKDYLSDFGNSLNVVTATHIEQSLLFNYAKGSVNAAIRFQDYQTIDESISDIDKPFRRLPQITLNTQTPYHPLYALSFASEFVRFDHKIKTSTNRIDLTPGFQFSFERSAGFFKPGLLLRQTNYYFDEGDSLNGITKSEINRTIPVTTIDSGVFLEREFVTRGGTAMMQTLEPRLFYVNVPFQDQTDIPIFDSSETIFDFSQLHLWNRFNGVDRVGDTNQLSVSLTTRFINNETGSEVLSAEIGQIFYMRDRRVAISGNKNQTNSQSDIVGRLTARFGEYWSARSDVTWNHIEDRIDKGAFHFGFKAGKKRIVNAAYLWTRGETNTEQTDFSAILPISSRWHMIARRLYAHRANRSLETLVGFEYNSCCWALRLLSRRYYDAGAENDKVKDSFMLQLEFKGLTSIGNPIEDIMSKGIPGFVGRNSPLNLQ